MLSIRISIITCIFLIQMVICMRCLCVCVYFCWCASAQFMKPFEKKNMMPRHINVFMKNVCLLDVFFFLYLLSELNIFIWGRETIGNPRKRETTFIYAKQNWIFGIQNRIANKPNLCLFKLFHLNTMRWFFLFFCSLSKCSSAAPSYDVASDVVVVVAI